MEILHIRQDCPAGFNFYSCGNGFRGCCSVEPCNPNSTCPDDKKPANSQTTTRSSAPPTTSSNRPSPSTLRTTLTQTSTGRSTSSDTSTYSTSTSTTASSTASTSSTSATSTTNTATPISTSGPQTETQAPTPSDGNSGPNKGLIAGSTIGGVVVLLLLIALMCLLLIRRRKKANQMHQATLERRESMRPMESDDKHGTFAPFGGQPIGAVNHDILLKSPGFYRGVKTFHQLPDTPRPENEREAGVNDPLTPERHSYRVVNADPSPVSSSRSLAYHSTIPSINPDPVLIDSQIVNTLIEMPDTSPATSSHHSTINRWGVPAPPHTDSPTLGALAPTVYKPYRPHSGSTSSSNAVDHHPPSLSPGPSSQGAHHNRSSSATGWVEIKNETGPVSPVRHSADARQHVMSWNNHTPAAAMSPPTSLSPTMDPHDSISPIEAPAETTRLQGGEEGKRNSGEAGRLWGR
ncbi:hypothetical protein C1H76_2199 [Elsinoe australis]|uniref:Uncharacterized protein n=1 Tax=Elsinoe australis TaxID=40998 RepID=A0A4U7B3V0_9PEZI|nr:hypothetical protein C1H76_2199 [Elsinoe australis]